MTDTSISAQLQEMATELLGVAADLRVKETLPTSALEKAMLAENRRANGMETELNRLRAEVESLVSDYDLSGDLPEVHDWSLAAQDKRISVIRGMLEDLNTRRNEIPRANGMETERAEAAVRREAYIQRVFAMLDVIREGYLPAGSYSEEGIVTEILKLLEAKDRAFSRKTDEFDATLALFRRNEVNIAEARDAAIEEAAGLRRRLEVAERERDAFKRVSAQNTELLAAIRAGKPGSVSLETLEKLNNAAGLHRTSGPGDVLDGLVGALYDAFGKKK